MYIQHIAYLIISLSPDGLNDGKDHVQVGPELRHDNQQLMDWNSHRDLQRRVYKGVAGCRRV